LLTNLKTCGSDFAQIKVGLEATGHYSDNLLEFLIANDLPTRVINPLHTNLYRKGLSLRKTKTFSDVFVRFACIYSIIKWLNCNGLKGFQVVQ
jgi:transposase